MGAHLSPVHLWFPYRQNTGKIPNYKRTNKGKVGLLWQPQQLLSIPGTQGRHARVIAVPVVVVIIGADQITMRRLLVVSDQVLVWETLEGHTQWPRYQPGVRHSDEEACTGRQRPPRVPQMSTSLGSHPSFSCEPQLAGFQFSGQVYSSPG